jgi:hypothetical protein
MHPSASSLRYLPTAALIALAAGTLHGQAVPAGLCARVRIEIAQELTLERIGFEATLEVTNNDGEDPLTEFSARLFFRDPSRDPTDPLYNAGNMFFIQPPVLENINRIDGSGIIGPTKKAVVRWFIIPKIEAGGTDPRGKIYQVGCELAANIRGDAVPAEALLTIPETITVVPDAQLDIVYFQPRYVTGDDPFTPEVESPIPFNLGVLVRNYGYGPANKLSIRSQQPRIVENLQGLLLVARLLGVRVQDLPLDETSLTVNLGDIPPGQARKGVWEMITSLTGTFVEFKASFTHAPELGGEETSVIRAMAAHFIIGEVLNDEPGRDAILDFLADTSRDGWPDTLYETDGMELPVNRLQQVQTSLLDGQTFTINLNADKEGWGYFRLDDPGQGRLQLQSVTRSDGKLLHPRNAWLEERYIPGNPRRDYFLHVFDRVDLGPYTYTAIFAPAAADNEPPVTRLRFSGEVTEAGGAYYITPDTQMYFTAVDQNPVSIQYRLDDGEYRPALPFTISQPGTYLLAFYARDTAGNQETVQTATLILPGGDQAPGFSGVQLVSDALYLRGETVSIRPGAVRVQAQVAAGPLPVDAKASVYAGVRAWPWIAGLPPSPSPFSSLGLAIGGDGVDFYRYRLNNGAWSNEQPTGQPLELSGLNGNVSLAVLGRPAGGAWPPDDQAVTATWTVAAGAPAWTLTDAPTHPSRTGAVALTVARPGASLYRWRADASFFHAEEPLSTPLLIDRIEPGDRRLSFIGFAGGEWDSEAAPAIYDWTCDPAYGSNYTAFPLVRQWTFANSQGTTLNIDWDGRDGSGRLQPPGWYTILLELTDSLGQRAFSTHLVKVSDLAGAQHLLAAPASAPRNPHARGAWAVWQQRLEGGAWNIVARRMDQDEAQTIAVTSASLSQENPRTDGRYVVWQARRPDGNWDIRFADLDDPVAVMDVTDTANRNETNPVIDWPWIVYQTQATDIPGAPWQLEAYNLLTQSRDFVYPGPDDQLYPAIDAGSVVWQDFRNPGYGEIYLQNLETGLTRRLTNDLYGQYFPAIRGHWIAWQDNRHGRVEIYGYHLHEEREVRLTDSPGNKARPYIEGGLLLYEDDSFTDAVANFHLLDLASGQTVPLTYDAANKGRGVLVAGQLLWQEGAAEPFALRSADLPALQPVFRNSNMVAVTQGMADRYGDAHALLADWQAGANVQALRHCTALLPEPVWQEARWEDGAAAGDNFALVAGSFVWVEFAANVMLDLGDRAAATVDLQAGISAFSHDSFPLDYSAYRLARELGIDRVAAIRLLDAANGFWRSLEITAEGDFSGPDFSVPPVAVLLIEMREAVTGWSPHKSPSNLPQR